MKIPRVVKLLSWSLPGFALTACSFWWSQNAILRAVLVWP